MTGSYTAANEYGGFAREVERLDMQADIAWPEELAVLRGLGLETAGVVLDAGCGSGAVLQRLRAACPTARLVGLDLDSALLKVAAARLATDPHVVLLHGDAAAPPLPDRSIDLAVMRYVFQHLPDPERTARGLRRVLRPGGRLVAIDVDNGLWGAAEPDFSAASAAAHRVLGAAQAGAGGDRLVARRLPRVLRAAGYTDVVVRPFAWTSDQVGLASLEPQISPERLAPLVASGRLGLAEYAKAMLAWQQFVQADGFVMLLGFAVSGRAPG